MESLILRYEKVARALQQFKNKNKVLVGSLSRYKYFMLARLRNEVKCAPSNIMFFCREL